jgi:large subunit ribosomal protein L15
MMIHEITPKAGRYKRRKRIGRGPGSGVGKTSGRGHKGAGSRSGSGGKLGFEGGQMPLYRRVPKRGFSNVQFRTSYVVVNLKALDARFNDGEEVTPETLAARGLIRDAAVPVKVLAEGELSKKLKVSVAKLSKQAAEKITAAGGSAVATADSQ